MGPSFDLDLHGATTPVSLGPGDHLTLKGSFHSSFDGSEVDAATTIWPGSAPGGPSVDAGGLVDFDAGGLRVISRDPVTHVVEAVATGAEGRACRAAHLASPCIVLRTRAQATSRLLEESAWSRSLVGRIRVEGATLAPVPTPAETVSGSSAMRLAGITLVTFALVWLAVAGIFTWKAYRESPGRRLRSMLARVEAKLPHSDPVLAAVLTGPVETARRLVSSRAVDPRSRQGARIQAALAHVDARLDEEGVRAIASRERQAADALLVEMRTALDAAEEAIEASEDAALPAHHGPAPHSRSDQV